jgi:hypothetical protein
MLAIRVELEYIFVARSLSEWVPKGELNVPIAAESEIMDSLKLLTMNQWSDSSMLAIRVELEYRSIARSLSGWGSNGELNAPITAGNEVTDF